LLQRKIPSPTYNFTTTVVATYVQAGDPHNKQKVE
jgi:hypothetical protein